MAKNKLSKRNIHQGEHVTIKVTNTSTNHLKPIFSLEYLQARYCISNCTTEQKSAFADALLKRSRMTWNEIINAPRHGLGQEKIAQQAIRAPLPAHLTLDAQLIALRFAGKAAMVGRREGRLFVIYWLDHNFSLYQH